MEQIISSAQQPYQAYEQIELGNYTTAINMLVDYTQKHSEDYEAYYRLSFAYMQIHNYKESFKCCKKAAESGDLPIAQALLALHYAEGLGIKKSGADAWYHLNQARHSEDINVQNSIHLCLGIMYMKGIGVSRDIPHAYKCFKACSETEETQKYIQIIENNYPVNEDGCINLKHHQRNKWASIFLYGTIVCNFILSIWNYTLWEQGKESITGLLCSLLFMILPINVILWQKWAFKGMIGALILGIPTTLIAFLQNNSHLEIIIILNLLFYGASIASLLIREKGYAHPWCSLTGKADNGVNPLIQLINRFFGYGEGNAFQIQSPETRRFHQYHYIALGMLSIVGIWAAVNTIHCNIGWEVEWNIFNSLGLWGTFSIIGFFLQFFNWPHMSFKQINQTTSKHEEKNNRNNLIDTMEGQVIWPILSHLFFIPIFFGTVIYYTMMLISSLISSLVPYILGILTASGLYIFFRAGRSLEQRRYRNQLLVMLLATFTLIYGMIIFQTHPATTLTSDFYAESFFVQCTTDKINLRQEPSTESAKLFAEASCNEEIYFNDTPENYETPYQLSKGSIEEVISTTDDWYQLSIKGTPAYAMKDYFVAVQPEDLEEIRKVNKDIQSKFYRRDQGKFKNRYVYYVESEMDQGTFFYLGQKKGKGILFTKSTFLNWDQPLIKIDAKLNRIIYSNWPMKETSNRNMLDWDAFTDEQLSQIFETAENVHTRVFYFPQTKSIKWFN